jgi:hypothetical protein
MPSVSKKQHGFMAAVANNPKFAKKVGVPSSVGKEFLTADKGKTFKKGGEMKNTARMNRLEELGRVNAEKASTPKGKANLAAEKKRVVGELKYAKGGMAHSDIAKDKPMMKKVAKAEVKSHEKKMHKMAGGGKAGQLSKANGIAVKGKTKGKMVKMKYGGSC